jgi:hypothetical protein
MSNKIYPKSATKTQRSEFRMVWLVISVLGLLGSLVWLAYIIIGILNYASIVSFMSVSYGYAGFTSFGLYYYIVSLIVDIFLIVVFYWMFKHSRSA